ncbi:MAG: HPt (histidine-containing phosphotransfer) domain-containing protein [Planctomycetota bacterium]|jgi:HPt (histidine-containing phosphotransfer) domain-containing protein
MNNVLDHAVLDELLTFADDGDPELLVDLIQMFLEDGPSKVEAVSQGLALGDFDMAERAAHSLKGSSGNLGAKIVQEICEQLQIATRAHELETSRKLAPMLEMNFAAAEDALKQVLAQYE